MQLPVINIRLSLKLSIIIILYPPIIELNNLGTSDLVKFAITKVDHALYAYMYACFPGNPIVNDLYKHILSPEKCTNGVSCLFDKVDKKFWDDHLKPALESLQKERYKVTVIILCMHAEKINKVTA